MSGKLKITPQDPFGQKTQVKLKRKPPKRRDSSKPLTPAATILSSQPWATAPQRQL